MADDLERIRKALAADPNVTYGELVPMAREDGQLRPALPGAARSALQGLLGLMEGAAGEKPAGQNLSQKETEALMGLASPSVASRPSPSTLAANWGGKRHQRNIEQGLLWHGTNDPDAKTYLPTEGFTLGQSAELGLKGTSISDDPSISFRRFAQGEPEGMFRVDPGDISSDEVFNLRPSAYAVKDYQKPLPAKQPDPDQPEASETVSSLAMKEFNETLEDQGFSVQELGSVVFNILGSNGRQVGTGVSPISAFLDAQKQGAFDNVPIAKENLQKLANKAMQPQNQNSLAESDPVSAANVILDRSGFEIDTEDGAEFLVVDHAGEEVISAHKTVSDAVNSLAKQDLIPGTDQQKILSEIKADQSGAALEGAGDRGAAMIAKPQSWYFESEYFAPQQTEGQQRLKPRRTPLDEFGRHMPQQSDVAPGPDDLSSAPSALRSLKQNLAENSTNKTARREQTEALAQDVLEYGTDPIAPEVNRHFFPRQHEQMEEIKQLSRRWKELKDARQKLRFDLEEPGAELDAPNRKKFDDMVREETRLLDEIRSRIENSDVPTGGRRTDERTEGLDRAVKSIRSFFSGPNASAAFEQAYADGPIQKKRRVSDFLATARQEYSTPQALTREIRSYIQANGPSSFLEAVAGQRPAEAVKMIREYGGRAQMDSDDPGSIIE